MIIIVDITTFKNVYLQCKKNNKKKNKKTKHMYVIIWILKRFFLNS